MQMNLTGRTAVVTGGSKGIGLATTAALAAEGARVVVGSRTISDELAALIEKFDVTAVTVDLSTPAGPGELVDAAVRQHGGIDILVNNVGASSLGPSILELTDDAWQRIFDVVLFSAVRTARAAVPAMPVNDPSYGGTIVNVSSANARFPQPAIAHYCAAKAAVTNVSKAMAVEFADRGIRVNTVSPGPVRTPMWTARGGFAELFSAGSDSTPTEFLDRDLPASLGMLTGRVGASTEVADLITYLASDRSTGITGADFVIDGGTLKQV